MTIRQRTPEWYAARRLGVTSTDMVAILGLSRYQSEGDVARYKDTDEEPTSDPASERRMRLGLKMERLVADEEEVEHGIRLRRVARLIAHPTIPWALTSLDFERVGQRVIVEVKTSASRRWDGGLPEDVEVQVRWQMGVARYPRAHVAALRFGQSLACFDVEHDEETFQRMLVIGADFMRRKKEGGPFEENRASVRRAFPLDDGTTVAADAALDEAVHDLLATRRAREGMEEREDALVAAIQTRMGPATYLVGSGYSVTWRRAKDATQTEWRMMAEQLLADHPDRETVIARHTILRPGSRRFLVREEETR